jgi:2-polyprenyl-3-methyl-5-hydroxy-6-metoxy-1,4-benzoquinol methylase
MVTEIPFYYKLHDSVGNGGLPTALPFRIQFDDTLKMYCQQSSEELRSKLETVYDQGSLVEGSVSTESGKIYLEKITKFLDNYFPLQGQQVLEIGCGTGALMVELKKRGAFVKGLEPGNHMPEKEVEDDIVHDYFPSNKLEGVFDLVIHFGVLEHIENPILFLLNQKRYLKREGKVFLAVPNCEPFFEAGDMSIFIHEHFSYFTRQNLSLIVEKGGFFIEEICIIEGMITAVLSQTNSTFSRPAYNFERAIFENKANLFTNKIASLYTRFDEKDVAVYAPIRALNVLYKLKRINCRLVDDNTNSHRRYLPCFNQAIESFKDLLISPPKCILIYSRTFADQIKQRCLDADELKSTDIFTLDDVINFDTSFENINTWF